MAAQGTYYFMQDQVEGLVTSLVPRQSAANPHWVDRIKRLAEIGALAVAGSFYSAILMLQL